VEAPGLGTLLKAVVVADAGCAEAELVAFCRERLAPFKVPRLIEFREALPRSPLGKVLKSELGGGAAALEVRGDAAAEGERARRKEFLAALIREEAASCLQRDPPSVATSASFESLGFDSLRAAELHLRLVRRTGLPLSITVLWNYPSIDELAAALSSGEGAGAGGEPAAEAAPPAGPAGDLGALLGDVEGLSEAEVDALFRAR
jgi:acyl carrier protein